MMPWIWLPPVQRRLGDIAHQPQAAAAEHQRIAHFGDAAADGACRVAERGIGAERGTAKDADGGAGLLDFSLVHVANRVARERASS